MTKGLLIWIFKDDLMFYIRFLNFISIGFEKIEEEFGSGYRITIGIWKLEFGFHLIKRTKYVKRIKNKESTKAFA